MVVGHRDRHPTMRRHDRKRVVGAVAAVSRTRAIVSGSRPAGATSGWDQDWPRRHRQERLARRQATRYRRVNARTRRLISLKSPARSRPAAMRARPSVSGRVRFQTYALVGPVLAVVILRGLAERDGASSPSLDEPSHSGSARRKSRRTLPVQMWTSSTTRQAVHLEGPLTEEPVDEDLWKRVGAVDQTRGQAVRFRAGAIRARIARGEK